MNYKISKLFAYIMSDKLYILLTGYIKTKLKPNLKSPKTFYEKIQYIKINCDLNKYSEFVDKYKVRCYVERKIGNEYLIPLIDCFKSSDEIDFEKLPNKFVLKANHSSGQNIICKDKNKSNINEYKKMISKWMKENFYYKLREVQYKNIEPIIMCEEYLEDVSGNLMDYKFFCSEGKPQFIQLDIDRFRGHKRNFYDLSWSKLPWKCVHDNIEYKIDKPKNLEKMIEVASKLCQDFQFVRVDLYSVGEKVYFGELTFTPGAGVELYEPKEINTVVGNLIDIRKY
ncbi:ATP-grasp fold amidoligase family protein [Clostridium sp. 1001275B_160808_H3]|uniref:ATP-grasp fold amidoligase family protein n=1 Tax=Clostridium sp. 1001275B_160808_H3 TaxID=2787110 RepID=UPI00189BDC6A|nr:ATP-grasp fold amidoligase family protein [Clostridium sp. 1001275B_160808_H3]